MKFRVRVLVKGSPCYAALAPSEWAADVPSGYFLFGSRIAKKESCTYLETRNNAEFLAGLVKRQSGKGSTIEEVEDEVWKKNVGRSER